MIIVEDGTGVQDANSYGTVAEFNAYHKVLGTDAVCEALYSDDEIELALIRATQYIETRACDLFAGKIAFTDIARPAEAQVTFTGATTLGETLTIGAVVLTVGTELSVSADAASAAEDLSFAINMHTTLNGLLFADFNALTGVVKIKTRANGTDQNGVYTLASTFANATADAALTGGQDKGPQCLSWPRCYAYDKNGLLLEGVPKILKKALFEYALRSASSPLLADPVVDSSAAAAGAIKRTKEKIGPLEEEIEYFEGGASASAVSAAIFRNIPQADLYLKQLTNGRLGGGSSSTGRVYR